jgi:hypothetical protein
VHETMVRCRYKDVTVGEDKDRISYFSRIWLDEIDINIERIWIPVPDC